MSILTDNLSVALIEKALWYSQFLVVVFNDNKKVRQRYLKLNGVYSNVQGYPINASQVERWEVKHIAVGINSVQQPTKFRIQFGSTDIYETPYIGTGGTSGYNVGYEMTTNEELRVYHSEGECIYPNVSVIVAKNEPLE